MKAFAAKGIADFPKMNAVVHNAGIARMEKLSEKTELSKAESTRPTRHSDGPL